MKDRGDGYEGSEAMVIDKKRIYFQKKLQLLQTIVIC